MFEDTFSEVPAYLKSCIFDSNAKIYRQFEIAFHLCRKLQMSVAKFLNQN